MEQQLELGLSSLKRDIRVNYVSGTDIEYDMRYDEVYIDKSIIKTCPNEDLFIASIQKKISRSKVLRVKKNALGLCILMILSKGYCITSEVIKDIDNGFIERCWECIHTSSHNVNDELAGWIKDTMEARDPVSFSMIYCNQPHQVEDIVFLDKSIEVNKDFKITKIEDDNVPSEIWHRNDAVYFTMMVHLNSQ